MGSMRYILMIYPALALVCAYGVFSPSKRIGGYLKKYDSAPAIVSLAIGSIVVISLVLTCLYTQPYYLDYYNSLAGGYQNIQDNKLFLLSWWGEGLYEPVEYVESHANGASVSILASGIMGTSEYIDEYAKNNTYMNSGGMGGFMPSGDAGMNRSRDMGNTSAGYLPQGDRSNMSPGMGGPQQSGGGLLDILGGLIGLKTDKKMNMSFGTPNPMGGDPFSGNNSMAGGPGGPQDGGNMGAGMQPQAGGSGIGVPGWSNAGNTTADYIIVGADTAVNADYDMADYTLVYESTFHGVPLYDVFERTS